VFRPSIDITGATVDFEKFRGKVVYAVNVASC
jgi:glutathione peroxidase-family protein